MRLTDRTARKASRSFSAKGQSHPRSCRSLELRQKIYSLLSTPFWVFAGAALAVAAFLVLYLSLIWTFMSASFDCCAKSLFIETIIVTEPKFSKQVARMSAAI